MNINFNELTDLGMEPFLAFKSIGTIHPDLLTFIDNTVKHSLQEYGEVSKETKAEIVKDAASNFSHDHKPYRIQGLINLAIYLANKNQSLVWAYQDNRKRYANH